MRVIRQTAVIQISDKSIIGLDYENINYSKMGLKSHGYSFTSENNNITQLFTNVHSIRIGCEYNLYRIALRGGYSYYTSPYVFDKDQTRKSLAFGMSVVLSDYLTLDMSYTNTKYKSLDFMYGYSYVEPLDLLKINNDIIITMRVTFP